MAEAAFEQQLRRLLVTTSSWKASAVRLRHAVGVRDSLR